MRVEMAIKDAAAPLLADVDPAADASALHGENLLRLLRVTAPRGPKSPMLLWSDSGKRFRFGIFFGQHSVLQRIAILLSIAVMAVSVVIWSVEAIPGEKNHFTTLAELLEKGHDVGGEQITGTTFLLVFYLGHCHNSFRAVVITTRNIQGRLQDCWLSFHALGSHGHSHSGTTAADARDARLPLWIADPSLARFCRFAVCATWVVFCKFDPDLRPAALRALTKLLSEGERAALVGVGPPHSTSTTGGGSGSGAGDERLLEFDGHKKLLSWMAGAYRASTKSPAAAAAFATADLRADLEETAVRQGVRDALLRLRGSLLDLDDYCDDNGFIPYAYVNLLYLAIIALHLELLLTQPAAQSWAMLITVCFTMHFMFGVLELCRSLLRPFRRRRLLVVRSRKLVDLRAVLDQIHGAVEAYCHPAPELPSL
jgi:hypothetical protein